MKKKGLILPILLSSALLLTACNEESISSIIENLSTSDSSATQVDSQDSNSSKGADGSSSQTGRLTDWPAELKALITEHYNDELPFVALDAETLEYEYVNDETNGEYISVVDYSEVNALANYGNTLTEAGFEVVTSTELYGIEFNVYTNSNILVTYYFVQSEEYSCNCISISADGEWYADFVDQGYTYETEAELTATYINGYIESGIDFITPSYTTEYGFVYGLDEYDDFCAVIGEDVVEDYIETLEAAEYDIIEQVSYTIDFTTFDYVEYTTYFVADPTHTIGMAVASMYGYTFLTYFLFDNVFTDVAYSGTAWPTDVAEGLADIGCELPFIALGNDVCFTDEYYEEYGCYSIEDCYFGDLTEDYGDALTNAGWEIVTDEESDYYGYYYKNIDDNDFYVTYYWNYGNVIDIYCGSETPTTDEDWYEEFVENGYSYEAEDELTATYINEYIESGIDFITPSYDLDNGFVYGINDYGDLCVVLNESVADDYIETLEAAEYEIVVDVTYSLDWETWEYVETYTYYVADSTHTIAITAYEDNGCTYLSFFPFDETFTDVLYTGTAWDNEIAEVLEGIGCELPFIALGADATITDEYYEDYGCYSIEDSFFGNLTEDYGEILEDAGWTYVDDEEDDYYGCYANTFEGTTYYVSYYWYFGNSIDIYFEEVETFEPGEFDFTSASQVTKKTSSQVVFENGDINVTFNQGTASSGADNYVAQEYGTRCYKGGTVVLSWDESIEVSAIEITINKGASKDHLLDEASVTGGTVTAGESTKYEYSFTITPNEGVNEITIDCSGLKDGRMTFIDMYFVID